MKNFVKILIAALIISIFLVSCKKDKDNNSVVANPLCFTAEENGATVQMQISGDLPSLPYLEYSYDKVSWNVFTPGTTAITLDRTGDKFYLRGDNPNGFPVYIDPNLGMFGDCSYVYFATNNKKVAVSGNIMSLLDPTCSLKAIPCPYCFVALFAESDITTAPELPATNLTEGCYYCMFGGCKSLFNAPELPATTLVEGCYLDMFVSCTKLKSIKVHFSDWGNLGATWAWLANVSQNGTFYCPSSLPQEFGPNRIPENWTVETF